MTLAGPEPTDRLFLPSWDWGQTTRAAPRARARHHPRHPSRGRHHPRHPSCSGRSSASPWGSAWGPAEGAVMAPDDCCFACVEWDDLLLRRDVRELPFYGDATRTLCGSATGGELDEHPPTLVWSPLVARVSSLAGRRPERSHVKSWEWVEAGAVGHIAQAYAEHLKECPGEGGWSRCWGSGSSDLPRQADNRPKGDGIRPVPAVVEAAMKARPLPGPRPRRPPRRPPTPAPGHPQEPSPLPEEAPRTRSRQPRPWSRAPSPTRSSARRRRGAPSLGGRVSLSVVTAPGPRA